MSAVETGKRACDECGALFVPKRKASRFCSLRCQKRYYKKHPPQHPEDYMEFSGVPIREFTCRMCHRNVRVYDRRDQRTVFCSQACEKKFWKHPLWKRRETANQGMSGGMSLESLMRREREDLR